MSVSAAMVIAAIPTQYKGLTDGHPHPSLYIPCPFIGMA